MSCETSQFKVLTKLYPHLEAMLQKHVLFINFYLDFILLYLWNKNAQNLEACLYFRDSVYPVLSYKHRNFQLIMWLSHDLSQKSKKHRMLSLNS